MTTLVEYGRVRPAWADDEFGQWVLKHCSADDASPVFMPMGLLVNGSAWVREQFSKQGITTVDDETARVMFGTLVAIHVSAGVPQLEVFEQIFHAYLRTIPTKA